MCTIFMKFFVKIQKFYCNSCERVFYCKSNSIKQQKLIIAFQSFYIYSEKQETGSFLRGIYTSVSLNLSNCM